MVRTRTAERTAPGSGVIAVSAPVAAMLERTAIGVEGYLRLVRTGMLDAAGRSIKFSSKPSECEKLRERFGRDIPEGLPDLSGDVTWRKNDLRWSLDVNHGLLGDDVHWWEQIARGTGDAQLRLDGVNLPASVTMRMAGRPLNEFVEHPALTHDLIIVRDAISYPPIRSSGFDTRGSLQMRLDVPRIAYPD